MVAGLGLLLPQLQLAGSAGSTPKKQPKQTPKKAPLAAAAAEKTPVVAVADVALALSTQTPGDAGEPVLTKEEQEARD
eukprot:COSAG05_NODE_16502_length_344_cov_1.693878_1_plen_77_part_01